MDARYFRIENFLSKSHRNQIFDFTVKSQQSFVKSSVASVDSDKIRRSRVIYEPEIFSLIANKLELVLPIVIDALDIETFDIANIDCQVTASGDGDFFAPHLDRTIITQTRQLTYVYYFHQTPKPFFGGELVLHLPGNEYRAIEPIDNTVIFFDSKLWHEVLPVRCPNASFESSRFTLNGWFNHPV